jgi:hypothetical protein
MGGLTPLSTKPVSPTDNTDPLRCAELPRHSTVVPAGSVCSRAELRGLLTPMVHRLERSASSNRATGAILPATAQLAQDRRCFVPDLVVQLVKRQIAVKLGKGGAAFLVSCG